MYVILEEIHKERMLAMDLTEKSLENIQFMINKILEKLKIINIEAMNPGNYTLEQYEDIHDIYQLVMKRTSFSPSEMQAIAEELGSLRSK